MVPILMVMGYTGEMSFTVSELSADRLEGASPQEVLRWALKRFGDKIAIASSFGVEDVALIDMASEIRADFRIFCLDTGRLHQQTYDTMDRIRNRYGVRVEVLFPNAAEVEAMVTDSGLNLFYDSVGNRKQCCDVRKVRPLRRVLSKLDAWITGIRREQNVTRAGIPKISIDHANGGLVKVNPLAAWSVEDVWTYVRERKVPYNPLHDGGYPSIGCEPCTRPVQGDEGIRSGRWWWEDPDTRECGLHLKE
jgi:phosphoadenosine phosphosulfate reductase